MVGNGGDDRSVTKDSVIIAKAGGSAELPENSLAAIAATVELAAHATKYRVALEVDVRCSRDGHLVLHHDATLERMTTGKGLLRHRSLNELKTLSIASNNQPILTLNEAWENFGDLETVIELHDASTQTLAAIGVWLKSLEPLERQRVIIASELSHATRAVREAVPSVRTSATFEEALRLLACSYLGRPQWATRGHIWMIPRKFLGMDLLNSRLISTARYTGGSLCTWVVDDAETAHKLFALGVSGVFTTRPQRLVTQLEQLQTTGLG